MISKEEYEKLKDSFCKENMSKDVKTYYSEEDKDTYSLYLPYSDEDILNLLEDKEFVKSLTPTELGFLVTDIDIEVPENFREMYRTLCQMTLTLQLLPELSDKMHVLILYYFYMFNIYMGLKYKIEKCYDIGYYRDELIEIAKYEFYNALSLISSMYFEYHNKELDVSNVTYEDYAVTIEYIMEKEDEEGNHLYWKNAIARHLIEDFAEELYHL